MLKYEYRPEGDKDIVPTIKMEFEEADDLDLYEHVENFKYFLKALSFPESLVDRVAIVDNSKTEED